MIVSAFPVAGGIQINRETAPGVLSVDLVYEGDPGWLDAVAAAAQFGGETQPDAAEPVMPLELAQRQAYAAVNAVRGEVRKRFLTDLPFQDTVYARKETQAKAWVAARAAAAAGNGPEPDIADYPAIAVEVSPRRTAETPDAVAQVYLNKAAFVEPIGDLIEGIAMEAFWMIDHAETAEAALLAGAGFPTVLMEHLRANGAPI